MNTGAGLERAALAMLRTLGGGSAWLLIPQPEAATGRSGLGLSAPPVSEIAMEPVLLQTDGLNATANGRKLYAVMAPCTVLKALDAAQAIPPQQANSGLAGDPVAGGENAVRQTLEHSRLRVGECEYRIVSVTAKWIGGTKLLYQLEVGE